jgi:site-specific recombinase XerD
VSGPETLSPAERFAQLPEGHQAAAARFGRSLEAVQRSPDTRRLYMGALAAWLAAGGAPGHLDERLLSTHLAALRARCAVSTVNLAIKALRAFYRWQEGLEQAPPGTAAKLPRLRRPPDRVVRFLTVDQVGQVLAALPLHTFTGARDHAIVLVLFQTGLRAGELARLELGDLLDDGAIYVRGKGRRDRYAFASPELQAILANWIQMRRTARPGKAVALWITSTGRPLASARSVWEIVHRRIWTALGRRGGWHAVDRVGRAWRGHYPHELRASFATALLRDGCPITVIAQLLGHADASTTAHYLGVDLEHLKATIAKHPRARRLTHAEPRADAIPTSPADPPASPAPDRPTGTALPSSWSLLARLAPAAS